MDNERRVTDSKLGKTFNDSLKPKHSFVEWNKMCRHSFTFKIETDKGAKSDNEFDKTLDDNFQFEQTLKLK